MKKESRKFHGVRCDDPGSGVAIHGFESFTPSGEFLTYSVIFYTVFFYINTQNF